MVEGAASNEDNFDTGIERLANRVAVGRGYLAVAVKQRAVDIDGDQTDAYLMWGRQVSCRLATDFLAYVSWT